MLLAKLYKKGRQAVKDGDVAALHEALQELRVEEAAIGEQIAQLLSPEKGVEDD